MFRVWTSISQERILTMRSSSILWANVRRVQAMSLIRNLFGLMIIASMLPLCSMAFNYTSRIPFEYNEISDELALAELREILLISYDMNMTYDTLYFIYQNKPFTLSMVNRKMLLQPGTQIYLNDIDELHFERRGNTIYVMYERNMHKYERAISSAEGIYIDSFSDCDVHDDVSDSSES